MTVPDPGRYPYPYPPPYRPRSVAWRILNSLWLIVPIIGFGCVSGAPLIVLGALARRKSWWISGVVYTVVSTSAFAVFTVSTETTSTEETTYTAWSDISIIVLMVSWLACIVHSIVVNVLWLQWRAGYAPWPERVPPPVAGQSGSWPSTLPPGLLPPPGTYYPPAPTGTTPTPAPTPAPTAEAGAGTHAGAGERAPGRLDLNTATVEQLAALPGLSRPAAERIVAEREARGGFQSLADLAGLGEVAPHELARIRDYVTCTPRPHPGAPPRAGRVVDV